MVAQHFRGTHKEIDILMGYCAGACGFECHIDVLDALVWLEEHKPELYKKVKT